MQIFIGYDPRDDLAAKVCVASLKRHTSRRLEIKFLRDHELRRAGLYDRPYRVLESGQMVDERDGRPFSTLFAFTRFLTPWVAKDPVVLFTDADFMFRADPVELLDEYAGDNKAVSCVHHDYAPTQTVKMDGVSQSPYRRKNWSSLMLMRPALCREYLTTDMVNTKPGQWLHGLEWLPDELIGSVAEPWNWLDGWSSNDMDAKAVHFTRGTPDMIADCNRDYRKEWLSYAEG